MLMSIKYSYRREKKNRYLYTCRSGKKRPVAVDDCKYELFLFGKGGVVHIINS